MSKAGHRLITVILTMVLGVAASASVLEFPAGVHTVVLRDDWRLQPADGCDQAGEAVSTPGFPDGGWHPATVPATVLGALVRQGEYRDIYHGRRLEQIPAARFQQAWWYRREFTLRTLPEGAHASLVFEGINYRANVFVNGRPVAKAGETSGAFRIFEFDITPLIREGRNALAVQVFPPQPGDFSVGFVDWNPAPPDRNMGLFREVKLRLTGPVSLEKAYVRSRLRHPGLDEARLTISACLVNHSQSAVSGDCEGAIGAIAFKRTVTLAPGEKREIIFSPEDHPGLIISKPRLWWPNLLGEPDLYRLDLSFQAEGRRSDGQSVTFGIREVSDYINEQGHRGYLVNGRKVLILGGGWVDDLLLNEDEANLEAQFRYIRHLNLNTVRLEGFWGCSQSLYDLADRYGILLMAGWSCQWEWDNYCGKPHDEHGCVKTPEDMALVAQYLRDQVIWLRNHPSILVWVLGSDAIWRPEIEKQHRADLALLDPDRPVLSACKWLNSSVSGPTGVKMAGPYDYVTPNYWYLDKENGGAFGFNTETGPGPQPVPLESLRRMIPASNLWPIDAEWDFHCGRNEFNNMKRYLKAFEARYGMPGDAETFTFKAQAANYEAMRAMFEAFVSRKPRTTGLIQWMLNAAWPKLYWQLYDYYLMPNGAFFGARKACQPLTLIYDYGRKAVMAVNNTYQASSSLKAEIRLYSFDSKLIAVKTYPVSLREYESLELCSVPKVKSKAGVYFLSLKLQNPEGKTVADNFYWLGTKEDELDFKNSEWFCTPNKSYTDFRALGRLPAVSLPWEQTIGSDGDGQVLTLTLNNPTPRLAFFLEAKLLDANTGEPVLPVLWSDNYISLLPGESKTLTARFRLPAGKRATARVSGWNVPPVAAQ